MFFGHWALRPLPLGRGPIYSLVAVVDMACQLQMQCVGLPGFTTFCSQQNAGEGGMTPNLCPNIWLILMPPNLLYKLVVYKAVYKNTFKHRVELFILVHVFSDERKRQLHCSPPGSRPCECMRIQPGHAQQMQRIHQRKTPNIVSSYI